MQDERITLQSEELWESLTTVEKEAVGKVFQEEELSDEEQKEADYIFQTGMVETNKKKVSLFSPLFAQYVSLVFHHVGKMDRELVFSKKSIFFLPFLKSIQVRFASGMILLRQFGQSTRNSVSQTGQ